MNWRLIASIFGTICIAALVYTALGSQISIVETTPASHQEGNPMNDKNDRSDEARRNYSGAPPVVQEIAVAIFNGQPIPTDALTQATPEDLSEIYTAPTASGERRNLLLDAFGFNLPEQAKELVAAGANVNVADSILARGAINKFDGSRLIPFPDFRPGMPWLQLYAQNNGNLNAIDPTSPRRLIDQAAGVGNLEALLYLLEQGADGWLQILEPDGYAHKPFFESQASSAAGIIGGEILFRVAEAGHLKSASAEQLQPLMQTLERILEDKFDNTGPSAQRTKWQVQKISQTIVENSPAVPTPRMAEMLAVQLPDTYAGWHLGPMERRSPPETPVAELDHGTVIWPE